VFEFCPLKSFFLSPTTDGLDYFIRTENLAPEVFLWFGEQVEIARRKMQAVDWMWQHCKHQTCNGITWQHLCEAWYGLTEARHHPFLPLSS
jgi:hypothetical protein